MRETLSASTLPKHRMMCRAMHNSGHTVYKRLPETSSVLDSNNSFNSAPATNRAGAVFSLHEKTTEAPQKPSQVYTKIVNFFSAKRKELESAIKSADFSKQVSTQFQVLNELDDFAKKLGADGKTRDQFIREYYKLVFGLFSQLSKKESGFDYNAYKAKYDASMTAQKLKVAPELQRKITNIVQKMQKEANTLYQKRLEDTNLKPEAEADIVRAARKSLINIALNGYKEFRKATKSLDTASLEQAYMQYEREIAQTLGAASSK